MLVETVKEQRLWGLDPNCSSGEAQQPADQTVVVLSIFLV